MIISKMLRVGCNGDEECIINREFGENIVHGSDCNKFGGGGGSYKFDHQASIEFPHLSLYIMIMLILVISVHRLATLSVGVRRFMRNWIITISICFD